MIIYEYHFPSFCLKTVSITTTGRNSDFIDWDVFEDGNEKYAKTKMLQ
jgi:hypothetical protein